MASVVAVVPAAVRVVEAAALPDPTFGVDGYADVGGEIGRPRKLSIGDDDKIVVVGSATPSYTGIFEFPLLRIERLLPNGAPDSTFGSNGVREISLRAGLKNVSIQDIETLPGGRTLVLVATTATTPPNVPNQLVMIDDSGQLDPTFGNGGIFTPAYDPAVCSGLPNMQSFAVGGDSISVRATDWCDGGGSRYVGLLGDDGNMTDTFGTAGWVEYTDRSDFLRPVGVDDNGRPLLQRYKERDLVRYSLDGTLDSTFTAVPLGEPAGEIPDGPGDPVPVDPDDDRADQLFGENPYFNPSDGRIVTTGYGGTVLFYLPDGEPDPLRPPYNNDVQALEWSGYSNLAFAPNGEMFASGYITAGSERGIVLLDEFGKYAADLRYGTGLEDSFDFDVNSSGQLHRLDAIDGPGVVSRSLIEASPPTPSENEVPTFDDWHAGDVHAHASGDTNLSIHPQCQTPPESIELTPSLCAFRLVDNTLDRASRFDTEWLIFTEHAPWLGFQRDSDLIYDFDQAEEQWDTIRDAVDIASNAATPGDKEIRGLMGAELGTAVPACTRVSATVDWQWSILNPVPVPVWKGLNWDSPGHFGVYYTPSAIDDSIYDCDETGDNGYVNDVAELGGFGGINHPDNDDGGSPWWCYSSEIVEEAPEVVYQGAEHQPQTGRFGQCKLGIDQYAAESPDDDGAFRSMELISGNNMPSRQALASFDMFLQNGYRIAAVGGGDGHTAPRNQSAAAGALCVLNLPLPGGPSNIGQCVDQGSSPGDPNHNKTGGSGRTLAYYTAEVDTGPGYSSIDPNDPVRTAISTGRTVATNGPKATVQIDGEYPGASIELPNNTPVELRIDWEDNWKWSGDILDGPNELNYSEVREDEFSDIPDPNLKFNRSGQLSTTVPSRIVVVSAERDGCGWDASACGGQTRRQSFDIAADGTIVSATNGGNNDALDVDPTTSSATIMVDPPSDGYVRVELYWEDGLSEKSTPDFVAVTSPIFVSELSTITIEGTLRDNYGAPLSNTSIEFCRTSPIEFCLTRTTRSDGTWAPVVQKAGDWTARAFPPSDRSDLGSLTTDLGTIDNGATRTIDLYLPLAPGLPPYIDPSGVVVDTFTQPIENATVTLWHSDNMIGPFVPVEDGSSIMSPANRVTPDLTNEAGEFRWDVLAGWYKVTASHPDCTSEFGETEASTPILQIPPPALDLVLVLDCRSPDTVAPVIDIDGPTVTNSDDVVFDITLSGEDDYAFATCLIDGGPEVDSDGDVDGEFPECGDQFTVAAVDEGVHRLTVLAFDDHQNASFSEAEFTVDRTAPTITINGVDANTIYTSMPAPTCTATDEQSGIDGECAGDLQQADDTTGEWTFTATAIDLAGNETTATVTFTVEQVPGAALWATDPDGTISIRGNNTVTGLTHSEGEIGLRGNSTLTGGVEHVGGFESRGNSSIEPEPTQVDAGITPPQLDAIETWRPTIDTSAATASPAGACASGTWKPTAADLTVDTITVPCDVEIGSWRFNEPITTTIVTNGSITVRGSNVNLDTGDRPSLIATGPDASIELRASNTTTGPVFAEGPVSLRGSNIEFTNPAHTSITSTGPQADVELRASGITAHGIYADGPISIRASNITFTNTERPSLVSNGPNADIELRSSNLTLAGRILTTGDLSHRGSNSTFGCGIYAARIEVRGSNSTFESCDNP